MSHWKFILARSRDLKPIGELTQARSRQLSLQLNRAGSASFTIPMDANLSDQIWPIESALLVYRRGSDGVRMIWSGFVNTIDEDVLNNRMTVNCVGWFDRLTKFFTRERLRYGYGGGGPLDNGSIILNLLNAAANGRTSGSSWPEGTVSFVGPDGATVRWPAGSSPNVPSWVAAGSKLPNEGAGGITGYVNAPITKTYEAWQNIAQAIIDLTELENGPDFDIDPVTRVLDVFRKRRRVLNSVVFGYNWGPANIAQFNRQLDASTLVNYHRSTGMTNVRAQAVEDAASQSIYGTISETTSRSDVTEPSILHAYSQAEVAIRKVPRTMYAITPFPWTPTNSSPEPFVDYRVGDQVLFRAVQKPRIEVSQQVRIFGITVGIDDEGNERLGQLQLYPG